MILVVLWDVFNIFAVIGEDWKTYATIPMRNIMYANIVNIHTQENNICFYMKMGCYFYVHWDNYRYYFLRIMSDVDLSFWKLVLFCNVV